MNIFYLDKDQSQCAKQYPDKHVVKMILETAQLLCTAHRVVDDIGSENVVLYKTTHKNHPSAVWTRTNSCNYKWLHGLLVELNNEYTHRYGKQHKVRASGLEDYLINSPRNICSGDFFDPPQAMPDDVKNIDTIKAYQDYYNRYKRHLFNWKNRNIPSWVN